jgi:hypothetical protein
MSSETTLTVDDIRRRYLDQPPIWRCPVTNLIVPKEPLKNLEYRRHLLDVAEKDSRFRQELYTAASMSILWWTNTFGWTYRLFSIKPDGIAHQCTSAESHVAWITWPMQDEHIKEVERAILEGYDLLTDKSRDVGSTWNHLVVLYHQWLFMPDRSFLMISRKEDAVDSPGRKSTGQLADPGTLFGKLDYFQYHLPRWMIPPYSRTTLHLTNLANNSRIDGESANISAGSSDRRTAILIDEAAKIQECESIKRSTRDVTACRLPTSTPNGAGTTFSKWRFDGAIKVITLSWTQHPEKAQGLYSLKDDSTGVVKLRSPWYDNEAKIRTPKELAIEVDIDHIGSGETFFEKITIQQCIQTFAKPPELSGFHLTFKRDISPMKIQDIIRRNVYEAVEVRRIPNGAWKFWMSLVDGRPDQSLNYIFGIDIGKGMGASNSVISVGCKETRKKIAEWASAMFAPHEFAMIAVASALWFGGANRGQRPLMIWESNGDPGIYFGRAIIKDFHYPSVFIDRPPARSIRLGHSRSYGWHSTAEKKAELLGDYRRALAQGTFPNPSEDALREAESYVYFEGGQIGPAFLQMESESARKTHGDRVIADALLNMGFGASIMKTVQPIRPPVNSFAHRYESWQKQEKERKENRVFDFRGAI